MSYKPKLASFVAYLSKHRFLDIYHCTFKKKKFLKQTFRTTANGCFFIILVLNYQPQEGSDF